MKKQMLTFAATIMAVAALGQRECASTFNAAEVQVSDPQRYQRFVQLEQFVQNYRNELLAPGGRLINANGIVVIPVVVHILHNGEPLGTGRNISVAQIQSQMDVLNEDFNRLNADRVNTPAPFAAVAASTVLEFRLACIDPDGNPTTGITRRQTTVTGFNENNDIKFTANGGENAWPATKYLNIWVSQLLNNLLGYAQFPADFATKPQTDGVVINTKSFGRVGNVTAPYNVGRTATHEVGHWLNLRHIWGDDGGTCDGTDLCDDTPNQGNYHLGCPGFPTGSCSNGPNGDMFMNYMDYTDDRCMNLFTNDQRIRMRAMFASGGPREAMVYSTFNIDPLYTAVCSNATVQLTNPACLTGVSWSITGPATIAGSGNSAVVTRTGSQNGTATVTAASGNYTESRDIVIGTGANLINFTQKQITCVAGKPYFYGAVADIPYSGFTYSWYSKDESNPNNPFILRQTGTENTADFPLGNNRGNRYYTIRVVANNTCGTIQTVNGDGYLYAPACNGSALRPVISAFPNPAMADVAISIEPGEPGAAAYMYNLELVDKMGTVLERKSYHAGVKTATISISKLSPGFYIARVFTGEEWLTIQVIKK